MPGPVLTYGDELFEFETHQEALITEILWPQDVVMILGNEKAGKSVLALQMACCLTTGQAFLDKYAIPKKVPIVYLQTEGKKDLTTDRLKRMHEAIDLDPTLFYHVYQKMFPLDMEGNLKTMISILANLPQKPEVLFIDSLYTSMMGDMNENSDTRSFITSVSQLVENFKLAVPIIHHERKESRDERGNIIDTGDKASYGSVFWRAWVEHILYLKRHKDQSRTLTCDTQRSGQVTVREDLILLHEVPLCFEVKGDYAPYAEVISHHLNGEPNDKISLSKVSGLSVSSVEKGLRLLLKGGRARRVHRTPALYIGCDNK